VVRMYTCSRRAGVRAVDEFMASYPIRIQLRLQTLWWRPTCGLLEKKESSNQSKHLVMHAREDPHWLFSLRAHQDIPRDFRIFVWCTWQDVRSGDDFRSSFGDDFQYAPRTSTSTASSQTRGLRTKLLLDENSSSFR
jgi:hypothetical protein